MPLVPINQNTSENTMTRNVILDLPLSAVMRPEIALPLQQVLQLYTVGNFLFAWRNPRNHKLIEDIFDSPQQAHHAAGICATWVGVGVTVGTDPGVGQWWPADDYSAAVRT